MMSVPTRLPVSVNTQLIEPARTSRQKRSLPSFTALALIALFCPAACTGSPATLALQPDFAMTTPVGIASVSIREAPPGLTDSEFEQLVRIGMERAAPNAVLPGPVQSPFPQFRIVWHVNRYGPDGTSKLVVNIFKGSDPFEFEQEVVANSAPAGTIVGAIESMTKRLIARDIGAHDSAPS
jgi:hypothetical protein